MQEDELVDRVADRLAREPGARTRGGEVWISCPFHDENTPSAAFRFEGKQKGLGVLYCSGACGKGYSAKAVAEKMGYWDLIDPSLSPAPRVLLPRPTPQPPSPAKLRAWWKAHGGPAGAMTDALLERRDLTSRLEAEGLFLSTLVDMGVGFIPDGRDRNGEERPAFVFPWDVTTGSEQHVTAMQLRFTDDGDQRYHLKAGSTPVFCNSIAVTEPQSDTLVAVEGFKKCASARGYTVNEGSVAGVASANAWPKVVERLPDLPGKLAAKFQRVIVAFDPGAERQAAEMAATIPGRRGWFAPLPMKPDDMLALTHDPDAMEACLVLARRP